MPARPSRSQGRPPPARALLLLLVGLVIVLSSLPAPGARGETQNLTAPTKVVTTGTQVGSYTATDVDADDGTTDGTTSSSSATSETQYADAGSAIVYGTQVNTYTATAADDNTRHQVTAADQFGAAQTVTPTTPSKNLRYGLQSGSYSGTNVNTNDGTFDTTLAKAAGDHTSPVSRNPTNNRAINNGGFTDPTFAYSSDNSYATTTQNNDESEYYGFGLLIPTDATIVSVELLVEWKVATAGPCIRWRASDDGGSSYSSYTTSASGDTTDRVDTWDITSSRSFTVSELNSDNFRVSIRTNRCSFSSTTWSIDHVYVRITFTYNVEHEYVFTVTQSETWWTRIDVSDSSAANAGCVGEIYRPGATTWESLSWSFTTTEAAHATAITSSLTQYVNASNEVKVRYRCTQIAAPDSVQVDLLTITVTYTPYVDTRLEYIYEFTTNKRAVTTGITVADRSHRVTDNVDAHVYNWQSTTWVSLWQVSQSTETAHSSSPSPATDFIHSSTGKIRVRYSRTTSSEGVLPQVQVDLLSVQVNYNQYTLDAYYQFTSQIDAASWARIYVNDSASAPAGATAYIYNFNTPGWESLGNSYTLTEAAHTYTISVNAQHYGDGSNRARVRYAWTNLPDPGQLTVDYLRVTVSGNTAPSLPAYTSVDDMASRNAAQLNDDGVDSTEVRGEVLDVNGENDIVVIQVRMYSSNTAETTTYSRTVTAGDRAQTLEPAGVDNQVVVWNPTADDDRLSFKFLHVWQMADHTNPDYYEFTAAAQDTWPVTSVFSAQKITKTVEAWYEMVVNDGVASRVYDKDGVAGSGTWGQWTAEAGVTLVQSGAGAAQTGRYVKIENIGTGSGSITVSWDGTAFVGDSDPSWTIPIDGVLDFKHAVGSQLDPSLILSWTTTLDDADGAITISIGGGLVCWVWYQVDVPDPTKDQSYSQTFTIG